MALTPRDLQLIYETGPLGILVVDPPHVREANPAMCALLGYSHRQIARVGIDELVHERDHSALHEAMAHKTGRGRAVALRLIDRRGDSVPAEVTARSDGGSWFLFVSPPQPGAFDEHTDDAVRVQVRARTRRLEESRDRYRSLVESLADGLVTLTPGGELLYLNRTFTEMLGHRARSTIVAKPFLDLVTPDDRQRVAKELKRIEQGEVVRFETSLIQTDDTRIAVLVAGRALPTDPDGRPRGLLLIITDYGERRDITERLALESKMEALSTLAGGIAHDFNNLLTGILGSASIVRLAGSGNPEVDSAARSIEDSAELAARLTQRLLALVRGQAPDRRILDLAAMVERTIELLGKLLPDAIEVSTSFQPGLAPVLADESQLQQAILNLCINARDAMLEDAGRGRLSIAVRSGIVRKMCDDGTLTAEPGVFLEDTGPGVPPELRRRVFDPFFTTKGLGRGMGLGLSTVYQLVEAHGGTVDVDSAAAGGARFRLALPAVPNRRPTAPSRPSRELELRPAAAPATVLVAEDETGIRELIAASLRRQGYTVFTAPDGREALGIWEKKKYEIDLLFLDVRMPHMDGTDFLRRARRDRADVPAILSSGFIPEEKEGEEAFARVLYLPKPYRIPDLLACVESGLSLHRRSVSAADTDSHTDWESVDTLRPADDEVHRGAGVTLDATATIQGVDALGPIRRASIGPDDRLPSEPKED